MGKRVMISQPMQNIQNEEIIEHRTKAVAYITKNGWDFVNTYFHDYLEEVGGTTTNIPLYYLAKSLDVMSHCDAVYFCRGWGNNRGCCIEHDAAKAYGLEIIYECNVYESEVI